MLPKVSHSPGPHESIAPNSPAKFEREHAFRSVFLFWSIYSPMGSKIEKRFEKHVPVRILRGSLAQSTREGRGSTTVLGALLKKIFENFFYDPLSKQTKGQCKDMVFQSELLTQKVLMTKPWKKPNTATN